MTQQTPGTKSAKTAAKNEKDPSQAEGAAPEADEDGLDLAKFRPAMADRLWFKAGKTKTPMVFVPIAKSDDGRVYGVELLRDFGPLYTNGDETKEVTGKKGEVVFVWAPSNPAANGVIQHAIKSSFPVSYCLPEKEKVFSEKLGRKTEMWRVECGYHPHSRKTLNGPSTIIMPQLNEKNAASGNEDIPF